MFVDISFNLPFDRCFTYSVPEEMQPFIKIGLQVSASFISQSKQGVIVKIHQKKPSFKVKALEKTYDTLYKLPFYAQDIAEFIANYYIAPFNEALHLFVVSSKFKNSLQKPIKVVSSIVNPKTNSFLQLNEEQETVFQQILSDFQQLKKFHVGLIFGITGSGKTEIYQKLIDQILMIKKQALLLLPEISLTAQTIQRFKHYYQNHKICIIHSRLSVKEKTELFNKIAVHEYDIILGPRSALFSPFSDLGIIIMDEEQDFSYKSSQSPRYHTKNVAYIVAKKLNIPFLLGSATPSLETFFAAKKGTIHLYELKNRYFKTSLASIDLVNMQKETHHFSEKLIKEILNTYQKGFQSLLFINRRGFASLVICTDCQYVMNCPHCSISLTYHKKTYLLCCHYCGYETPYTKKCPQCAQETLEQKGVGTERIHEEIQELFHHLTILRMDSDTTLKKNEHERLIQLFREKKADILIGTQMITKGLDFPYLTLVGVLSCDTILNLPDFRNAEYTFSLLTQVAGRSGRKSKGKVIIQTRYPEHYSILAAQQQNYLLFYEQEILKREKNDYPPFSHIIRLLVRSKLKSKSEEMIHILASRLIQEFPSIKIMGITSCMIEKIANQYRQHLFFKVKNPKKYALGIKKVIKDLANPKYHIEVDVDPVSLL